MARPVRRKISFDEKSVNSLLQELYDDSHNMKAKITRLFIKWEQKVKEGGEIAAIGEQIIKCILAEAKVQDQKIMLFKFLKEVVYRDTATDKKGESTEPTGILTTEKKNELMDMVAKAVNNSEINKK